MGIIKSLWKTPRGYFAMEETPAAIRIWVESIISRVALLLFSFSLSEKPNDLI